MLYRFIQNGKTEKVSRYIYMQQIENSGYNMHDFHQVDKAIKETWMEIFLKKNHFFGKIYRISLMC